MACVRNKSDNIQLKKAEQKLEYLAVVFKN